MSETFVPGVETSNGHVQVGRLAAVSAIVTGGGGDIGETIVRRYLVEGAAGVAIFDFDERAGTALAEELQSVYGEDRVSFAPVDVADEDSVARAVASTYERHENITTLVNNAGIVGENARLEDTDPGVLKRTIATNLVGPIICARAVVPHMLKSRSDGDTATDYGVINASSVVGLDGNVGQTGYGAAKGGLIAVTKGWALEWRRAGIRSNAVAPGYVDGTRMIASVPQKWLDKYVISRTPLGRLVTKAEIAEVYAFVAGNRSVNGQIIRVDNYFV